MYQSKYSKRLDRELEQLDKAVKFEQKKQSMYTRIQKEFSVKYLDTYKSQTKSFRNIIKTASSRRVLDIAINQLNKLKDAKIKSCKG